MKYYNTTVDSLFLVGSTTLDTQCTVFQERGESMTCYVRILRVCYVTSMFQSRLPLTALACKAFIPCQLTEQGMLVPPTFESQSETMRRALAWLQATGETEVYCVL